MRETNNTGGPAFPVLHSIDGNWVKEPMPEYSGMTLRDYFAAKAMQAQIISADTKSAEEAHLWVAGVAYEIADAMLKAREAC